MVVPATAGVWALKLTDVILLRFVEQGFSCNFDRVQKCPAGIAIKRAYVAAYNLDLIRFDFKCVSKG